MSESNITIGIEGLVGAGKTSICRELLNRIPNSIVIHCGNIYRAIMCAILSKGSSIKQLDTKMKNVDIKACMDLFKISIKIEDKQTVVYLDGKKIEEEKLQSKDASMAVSVAGKVANHEKIFEFGREFINKYKNEYNIIISGRDIMTMYPEVDYHLFITASLDERVKRKCIQYKDSMNEEEVRKNIEKRDALQEKSGFYKISPKTIQIDVTDCKSVEESTEKVLEYIKIPVTK